MSKVLVCSSLGRWGCSLPGYLGHFFRLLYDFGGACAPCFGGVAIFSHSCEEGEDYIVGFFWEELKDLIG